MIDVRCVRYVPKLDLVSHLRTSLTNLKLNFRMIKTELIDTSFSLIFIFDM